MEKLLTTKEVADILRLRVETVTRKAEQGLLPAIKVGGRWRIPEGRFSDWLRSKEWLTSVKARRKLEKPIKLKTYRLGEVCGDLSRREIYENL
ncbi:MAG: helix-turn-helix domain-containing protein [Chloroflexi bacterium]|nr:helix-turn-helix domain-containing protein [Chloroflexota bacterium]MBM3172130.1 helix-turn-helix domain-containing protein [Chloroflexota bacterium]MBM3174593.1 helix-turn-helix domain-containing protein [Chloroflexota bacterium]MBM4449353.1 helix-turn-helix domain-containing protein [Chloroflexota bacterium]